MENNDKNEADGTVVSMVQAGRIATITITGRFDFNCHREFRTAYEGAREVDTYVVDLAGTRYVDSSGLGMLLLLQEIVAEEKASVRIINCAPAVRRILEIANFHKLFAIS